MTNREWLMEQMQNMSDEEFAELIHIPRKMDKEVCDTLGDCFPRECEDCKLDWLKAEYKEEIKLSDVERVILENTDKEYKWIARDDGGNMHVFKFKPTKLKNYWHTSSSYSLCAFNHLFQFIQWSDTEPYNIEELLKGG